MHVKRTGRTIEERVIIISVRRRMTMSMKHKEWSTVWIQGKKACKQIDIPGETFSSSDLLFLLICWLL